jgi:hypothetical protein
LNHTSDGVVMDAAADSRDDDGGHDGFFYLDGLGKAELLDIRETTLETKERACKLILACERRLDECA